MKQDVVPTAPAAPPLFSCRFCGKPAPGNFCEPCIRAETQRKDALLGYSRDDIHELADAARAAMRYWAQIECALRFIAAGNYWGEQIECVRRFAAGKPDDAEGDTTRASDLS